MALQKSRIEGLLDTVWAIAASKYVKHYTIGYTARSGHARFKEHKPNGCDHLVVLADKMTRSEAIFLETTIQERVRTDRRHTSYRKYDPQRRDGAIHPNAGNANPETALDLIHSVYMAWTEPVDSEKLGL